MPAPRLPVGAATAVYALTIGTITAGWSWKRPT